MNTTTNQTVTCRDHGKIAHLHTALLLMTQLQCVEHLRPISLQRAWVSV